MMYRILLVEDDINLGYILKEYLELHHYNIELAKDGEVALQVFNRSPFDMCILDVMLPKKDGFILAAEIKQLNNNTPLLFLTARALKIDKLKGFNIGADDYMVKPIDEEELVARIEAVMRRVNQSSADIAIERFNIGRYVFDCANQVLELEGKKQILTVKEAEVLKLLCEYKGKILDRKLALKTLWGENNYFSRRSMDVFISRLRKYFTDDASIQIKNVHSKGYILSC
jgi:DNA-binding response OmpR family regulator